MEYRKLGTSDLEVSVISLGSWLTYGVEVERDRAEACVRKAFDVGINLIDTANVYGRGAAESVLGELLQGIDRKSYVLATKLFFAMSTRDRGLSHAQIRKQINASLERLNTDYIDLYQCHRYDYDTPLEETMAGLTEAVREGKARYIGFSEWAPDQIQAALDMAPEMEKFVSSQPQYSMLWRTIEADVIPLCERNGISQIVWSPLAQGVLTGKYAPGQAPPRDSRRASESLRMMMDRFYDHDTLSAVRRLQPIARQIGCSMPQLALAWVLRQSNVASAIIGATRPSQVEDNAGAAGLKLDNASLAAIDDAVGSVAQR